MDLIAEYEEMQSIPIHTAVTFKFFSLFKVSKADGEIFLHWGEVAKTPLSEESYGPIKEFLKAQRSQLREGSVTRVDCAKRMWFWFQKILELSLFDMAVRAEILKWNEICELIVTP
jgi:hypothetical protein